MKDYYIIVNNSFIIYILNVSKIKYNIKCYKFKYKIARIIDIFEQRCSNKN